MSADGRMLVAGGKLVAGLPPQPAAPMCISTNSGLTWTAIPNAPQGTLVSIASAANGARWVAALGSVYTSTNGGVSWIMNNLPISSCTSVASSADGTRMVAAGTGICTTTNSGATWEMNNLTPSSAGPLVASSADGAKLMLTTCGHVYEGGLIYVSTNRGATWADAGAGSCNWSAAASSADGCRLVAGVEMPGAGGGDVKIYQVAPAPALNLAAASGKLRLCWIVPSTNCWLQQCTDLIAGNWSDLADTSTFNFTNLQYQVIISATNGRAFYRLH